MANTYLQQLSDRWNRVLLTAFWVAFGIYAACQLLFLAISFAAIDDFDFIRFLVVYMIIPDCCIGALIGAMEAVNRLLPRYSHLAILAGGVALSGLMIAFTSEELAGTLVIMTFPLLVSMLYFQRSYLYWTLAMSFAAIVALLALQPERLEALQLFELVIAGGILTGAAFTGLGIIRKGEDLLDSLEKSMKSEQELLIKNIVMDRLSKVDALTDLYNHKTFHEYMDKLIEQRAGNDFHLSLAVLDIDNFKRVNDTYGHWVGDVVLRQVAQCLKDRLDSDDFAARYGGEEFVAILVSKTPEQAERLCERIRRAIAETPIAEMGGGAVTISIGLHHYRQGDSKEELFKRADEALYAAKKTGKNKTVAK